MIGLDLTCESSAPVRSAAYRAEPSGRSDEWEWRVVSPEGLIVGFHLTRERAEAFAARDGEPYPVEIPAAPDDDQLDLFWGGA